MRICLQDGDNRIIQTTFDNTGNNAAPTAGFDTSALGDLAVQFDASASSDSDSPELGELTASNGIVSYGWDFNNDGNIDSFGRQVSHYFDRPGAQTVTLTVWDNQGATDTETQTIQVAPGAYSNLIADGDFSASNGFGEGGFQMDSERAGEGWIASNWSRNSSLGNGGAAVVSGSPFAIGLGQVILDNGIRRGNQTLSLDIKNQEGDNSANQVTVRVWGIDGEFTTEGVWGAEPQPVGALPMNSVKLLEQTVGGSSFDWKNFTWDLDFGDGHQFIFFQVAAEDADSSKGDSVAIDNIQLN